MVVGHVIAWAIANSARHQHGCGGGGEEMEHYLHFPIWCIFPLNFYRVLLVLFHIFYHFAYLVGTARCNMLVLFLLTWLALWQAPTKSHIKTNFLGVVLQNEFIIICAPLCGLFFYYPVSFALIARVSSS